MVREILPGSSSEADWGTGSTPASASNAAAAARAPRMRGARNPGEVSRVPGSVAFKGRFFFSTLGLGGGGGDGGGEDTAEAWRVEVRS